MKRTLAIDLPILLQGNLHKANIPLVYDTLEKIKGLKNVELIISDEDWQILYQNSDHTFLCEISKFLSEVKLSTHCASDRKANLTHNPDIISGLDQNLSDAIYLQLSVIHVEGDTLDKVCFVGFVPRFAGSFQLSTIWNKKARTHRTVIFSTENEVDGWVCSCKPSLSQLKHKAKVSSSAMGTVSPFTSLYKNGAAYADSLLQQAYMESQDELDFPHYLYTWDPETGTFVEFRHENHEGDSQHNYHGRDMQKDEYHKVPQYLRQKYHR